MTTARAIQIAWLAASCALAGCAAAPPRPGPVHADTRAEIQRAETAERGRRHDEARAHYVRAIDSARDPDSAAFARHEYAETLVSWGELPEARSQLERAVAASPNDASTWHDLGLLRHNAGDDPGAITALTRAAELAPHDARPRTALAALYWKRGDRASAARTYRSLLELDLPDGLRAKVEWALGELAKP